MTRRLREDELPLAAQVLGDAFHDDPLLAYAIPDGEERRRLAPAHFLPVARLAYRIGEVWWTGESVACWLPPGHHDATPEEAAAAGLDRMAEYVGADVAERLGAVFAHLAARRHALDVPEHWYLALLGVRRDRQGGGLGSAVVAPRLAAADAVGEWCFLETLAERNVPFYERHGFDMIEAAVEPSSGLRYWMFLRRSR